MQDWTAKVGSSLYILGLALVIGFFANSNANAQSTSIECAKEGERCSFTGTAEVQYGVGTKWAKKVVTSTIHCGTAGFGYDPAPNQLKTCVITPTRCATEGARCDFSGVRTVRFGTGNRWSYKTFKDGVDCNSYQFGASSAAQGDPPRQCFLSPVRPEKPINEITWLGTHNAISSTYYGFFIQNSQRDSITSQLDRGARSLEIDIVGDTPPGFDKGVYVCHCGIAPHSLSVRELNRFASGGKNQTVWPFQLPGWTHPTPYMRFSTILQEVDRWLIANPGEIVIVLMENNSANVLEFDQEIFAAKLQTGIFKHPDDKPWPTKSQLVRSNQRLILQVGDDNVRALGRRGEAEQSQFATPKYASEMVNGVATEREILQFGALSPAAYGNLNQYSSAKAKTAASGNQLLILGAFSSSLTDETTARAHNNYAFLNSAKRKWPLAGDGLVFPSILQVNQIHIGDALRFVNDLNGTDYLVSSKHDTIGDTSGNSWQIRFENNGAYNAGIQVMYWEDVVSGGVTVPVPRVVQSGVANVATGVARMVNIPRNTTPGKPISVSIIMFSTANFELYKEDIPADFTGSPVPCFMASGVLTAPKGGRCE